MVTANQLSDSTELEDIALDVGEECTKSGPISGVRIPSGLEHIMIQGADGGGEGAVDAAEAEKIKAILNEHSTDVIVRFQTPEAANSACKELNGRSFDGRRVEGIFVEDSVWATIEKYCSALPLPDEDE